MITWETHPALSKDYFTQRGIYALDRDSLQLCFYLPGSNTKHLVPMEFSANAGSNRTIMTFKRVPPPEQDGKKKAAAATTRDFEFHKKVPRSDLNIELAAAAQVTGRRDFTVQGLVLPLKITNHSGSRIAAQLAHEWYGGEWPSTGLYARVVPVGDKKTERFCPVYLAGKDERATTPVGLGASNSLEVILRMDWPGTGSVPAVPLVTKPGKYTAQFALVFEAGGRRQYVISRPTVIEYTAPIKGNEGAKGGDQEAQ